MENKLSEKCIGLTDDINRFLNEVSCIKQDTSLHLLIAKGLFMIRRTDVLISDLEEASKDETVKLTAFQLKEAVNLSRTGLLDVIEVLRKADSTKEMVEKGVLELKIQSIKDIKL